MDGTGDLFAQFLAELGGEIRTLVIRYPTRDFLDYTALTEFVKSRLPKGEPFVLLAESFSGPIAISLAAGQPGNLAGLILCASFARNPRPVLGSVLRLVVPILTGVPSWMIGSVMLNGFRTDELSRRLSLAITQVDHRVLNARFEAILNLDVTRQLDHVRTPSLCLRGTKDLLVPRQAAELIVSNRGNWRLVEFVAPHLMLQAVPREVAQIVKGFVAQLNGGGGSSDVFTAVG